MLPTNLRSFGTKVVIQRGCLISRFFVIVTNFYSVSRNRGLSVRSTPLVLLLYRDSCFSNMSFKSLSWWLNENYYSIWKETCWSQLQPLSVEPLSWLPQIFFKLGAIDSHIYGIEKLHKKRRGHRACFGLRDRNSKFFFLVVRKMFEAWTSAKYSIHIILQKLRILLKHRARLFVMA